jgi:hypothetical protein
LREWTSKDFLDPRNGTAEQEKTSSCEKNCEGEKKTCLKIDPTAVLPELSRHQTESLVGAFGELGLEHVSTSPDCTADPVPLGSPRSARARDEISALESSLMTAERKVRDQEKGPD